MSLGVQHSRESTYASLFGIKAPLEEHVDEVLQLRATLFVSQCVQHYESQQIVFVYILSLEHLLDFLWG